MSTPAQAPRRRPGGSFLIVLGLCAIAFVHGVRTTSDLSWSLTFLSHTAPAILLGVIITFGTLCHVLPARLAARAPRPVRQSLVSFAMVVTAALVVSAPFLWSIVGNYGLSLQNRVPTIWLDPSIELANWPVFLSDNLSPSLLNAFFALGLLRIVAVRRRAETMFILVWLFTALALFLYSAYGWQIMQARGIQIPTILPAHHFLFYARGAQTLLFGYGVAALPGILAAGVRFLKRAPPLPQPAAWGRVGKAVFTVVVVGIVVGHYPAFAAREDFVGLRERALDMYATRDQVDLFQWLRTQAEATDVFLAPDNVGLAIVGPAGRKLVVVDSFFSNPYLDWGDRDAARRAMWESLATGRCDRFHEVVEGYRVSHVILVESVTPAADDILRTCDLEPTFWTGQYTVLEVTR